MNKAKKSKNPKDETTKLTEFIMPQILSESSLNISMIAESSENLKVKWQAIVNERAGELQEILDYKNTKIPPEVPSIFLDTETEYVLRKVFPYLLPCLEKTVQKAVVWQALNGRRSLFDGIDQLSECLWNMNPKRENKNVNIFNMDWVREHLQSNPRPFYPKSRLWTEDYAARIIQRNIRKHAVLKDPEVNEMRNFWKKLEFEKCNPDIISNPLFAKHFASNWDLTTNTTKGSIKFTGDTDLLKSKQGMSAKSLLNILRK